MSGTKILCAAFCAFSALLIASVSAQPSMALRAADNSGALIKVQESYDYDEDDGDDDDVEEGSLIDVPGDIVEGAADGAAEALGLNDESAVAACARQFRSFNPQTGTYTTYEGDTVPCPYLRG